MLRPTSLVEKEDFSSRDRLAIPFNRPFQTGLEKIYIEQALQQAHISSNGEFTARCQNWLEETVGTKKAFLTHSGTGALELAALLCDLAPGDEVIMPSFAFVTTASSIALRGATPVFVDIRSDTLNLDESLIESALTKRTKAILPVHYAGVSCAMRTISRIADQHSLLLIEDAAHALLSKGAGNALGGIGHLAALSFHETKNITAGEAGALLVNSEGLIERAQVLWEKGTDRQAFMLGHKDKYTWQDLGSSFAPSELTAAFLWAQMEHAQAITDRRLCIWRMYNDALADLESMGFLRRPVIPGDCEINGHIYYILLNDAATRDATLQYLTKEGIGAVFHFVPLHQSKAGRKYGRVSGQLTNTEEYSARLIRLPLYPDLKDSEVERIVMTIRHFFLAT